MRRRAGGLTVVAAASACSVPGVAAARAPIAGSMGSFTRSMRDGRSDLHVMDLPNAAIDRLTDGLGFNREPGWSPDGTRIALASGRDGTSAPPGSPRFHLDLYQMRSDATVVRRLTSLPGANDSPAWSPMGSRIAFVSDGDCTFDTFTMADDGHDHGQTTDFQRTGGSSAYPRWSPDGSHIVFNAIDPAAEPAASIYSVGADGKGRAIWSCSSCDPTAAA